MRAFKVLLLTLTLAFFAVSAWGDGATDPNVKLEGGGGSQPTTAGLTATDPIFVTDGSGDNAFQLTNTSLPTLSPGEPLSSVSVSDLFVEVIPYFGENLDFFASEGWTCEAVPPTATSCSFPTTAGLYSSAAAQGFGSNVDECTAYNGAILACPAVEVEFVGPFYYGEHIIISVPEPGTVLLLLVGLPIVFAFGFKKRQTLLA